MPNLKVAINRQTPIRHFSPEILHDYVDGILSKPLAQEIDIHLRVCEICRHTIKGIEYYKEQAQDDLNDWQQYVAESQQKAQNLIDQQWLMLKNNKPKHTNHRLKQTWLQNSKIAAILLLCMIPIALIAWVIWQGKRNTIV